MATNIVRSTSSSVCKKESVCLGWSNGDYLEAIDNLIPTLCQDLDCYAKVCEVGRSTLLKDVMESILLDAPSSHQADDDYIQCITAIRDWLLEDVAAVARSFDVQFPVVLVDMLKVIVKDTALADDFVGELAARVVGEQTVSYSLAPC